MAQNYNFNWQVSGHVRQLDLLSRAVLNDRLAHAYVFAGPEQVGKKLIARQLAQHLLCEQNNACGQCAQCKTLTAGSNPDYLEIVSEDAIKIESVRDLSYKLALKPYGGQRKVAVIDNAHLMTTEAANSLLKILEEPKDHTYIVLVTHSPHLLLATINSRAQKISFGPLIENDFTDDAQRQKNEQRLAWFERFMTESLGHKMVLAAELAEQESSDLKNTMNFWLIKLQERLRHEPSDTLIKQIKKVSQAYRLIQQNANTKLLMANLMATT